MYCPDCPYHVQPSPQKGRHGQHRVEDRINTIRVYHQPGLSREDVLGGSILIGDDYRNDRCLGFQNLVIKGIGGAGKNENIA